MRARTIGQIASLIADQMGGVTIVAESAPAAPTATAEASSEVDLEALSDQDIERLLGDESDSDATEAGHGSAKRQAATNEMPSDQRARLKQWIESGEAQLHPLTFPQRELWEASPVPVADTANHICCLIEVRGLLTERDCRAAIQRVVDRQEVLRLSFLPGKERPSADDSKEWRGQLCFPRHRPGR